MIFTGTNLIVKRSIYTQTGSIGFTIDCSVDNTTGSYHFGLTGAQGILDFNLNSGRMYYQNQFIHSYRSNEQFSLEAQFTSGYTNIIRNGSPIIFGEPKQSGSFNYFYFTRDNAGMGANFSLRISGDTTPSYIVSTQGYLSSTGQSAVTGWFTNLSKYPINIFNSSMQASQNYSFGQLIGNISAGASGAFAFTGDYSSIDISQPILVTFNTNFSDISSLFYITNTSSLNSFVNLTSPTNFTFSSSNILNRSVSWLNYSGTFAGANFPTDLTFNLKYSNGTGVFTGIWNMFTGLSTTSLVSLSFNTGQISGSGNFPANSSINWQINYSGISGNGAQLVISGSKVNNPINKIINF